MEGRRRRAAGLAVGAADLAGAAAALSPLQDALACHVEPDRADGDVVFFRGHLEGHATRDQVRSLFELGFRSSLSSLITCKRDFPNRLLVCEQF